MEPDSLPEIDNFRLQQSVRISVTSFGETKWTGPVKIILVLPHKLPVKFNNGQVRWIKDLKRLRPLEDFLEQGLGYVLKSANIDPPTATNTPMQVPQSEQNHRALLRTTRATARQLIQDQQREDWIINTLQMRQSQLMKGNQEQASLINLIDASQRPYILGLSYKLCINQDLDFDPFTPEERRFWESLDPQERYLLLTGIPLALPEYHTKLCTFHKTPSQAPAAPAPLPLVAPGPSGGSGLLQPV